MKTVFTISILICMMLIASIVWSKIIPVPTPDHPTIQDGIDATVNGDTVLVADGIYTGENNKNLDFKGKAITVTSENGLENCIIDCEGDGMGFFFHSGEDSSSVLSGFTITRCTGSYAAAIKCEGASPVIANNKIVDNNCHGIISWHKGSNPIITDNLIANNKPNGIDVWNGATPIITDNVIANNGAGLQCTDGSLPMISGNIFEENSTGVKCSGTESSPIICDNTIERNATGINCESKSSRPIISGNTIGENKIGIACRPESNPIIGGTLEHANNFIGNTEYAIRNYSTDSINATYNYWGTVVETEIQAVIYDYYDDPNLGIVDYDPWTNETHDRIFGTGSIKGHVTYCQTGDPIKWALVIALQKPTKISKFTDKDGDYEISDLEPGRWWLIGIKKGYKPHIAKVEVKAGEPTTHDFCLEPK